MSWLEFMIGVAIYSVLSYAYRCYDTKPKKKFSKHDPQTILVTGTSMGLGKALVQRLARDYQNGEIKLLLISRSDKGLPEL